MAAPSRRTSGPNPQRGFAEREKVFDATQRANLSVYRDRLERELGVICQMGFAGYFLIVADFIRWARANGVPVGPGRGSGAGSLVAYSLGITDLDPLQYDLLFERFLNPERVSMPDFDIDFCMDGRDASSNTWRRSTARERVSQIITYGTMAAKAVVRDVGRVLGMGYGYVDSIAKLIPFELGITLDDALEKEPELKRLYKEDEEIKNLIDLAQSLEGLTRNAGMHAGGVVIAPSELTDFAPLYGDDKGGSVVTQFDKDDVEAAGLVKFDFLGLRTLTIIDWAVKIINARRAGIGEAPLDISTMPLDDAATFKLLQEARTTAVFQLESRGMKDLIRACSPTASRTSWRWSRCSVPARWSPAWSTTSSSASTAVTIRSATHRLSASLLQPVLEPTYGVILYQEQVMQIAQVLAGYTLGGADLLRRAMGKKKPEEMAKQRSIFVDGRGGERRARAAGRAHLRPDGEVRRLRLQQVALGRLCAAVVPDRLAEGAQPAAFMAAVLSSDMDHTDKVVILLDDMPQGNRPHDPAAGRERLAATISRSPTTRPSATDSARSRAWARARSRRSSASARRNGDFASLEDLCRRLDLSKINRRVLEALDPFGQPRLPRREPRHADAAGSPLRCSSASRTRRRTRPAGRPVRLRGRARARSRARQRAGPAGVERRACACTASAKRSGCTSAGIPSIDSRTICRASSPARIADYLEAEQPQASGEGGAPSSAASP